MNNLAGYAQTEIAGMGEAELEARALIRTASALNRVKENWETAKADLHPALDKNRRLWSILASAMSEEDCPQPQSIRNNILQLSMFVFKRTLELLGEPRPEGLDVLININLKEK